LSAQFADRRRCYVQEIKSLCSGAALGSGGSSPHSSLHGVDAVGKLLTVAGTHSSVPAPGGISRGTNFTHHPRSALAKRVARIYDFLFSS